MAAPEVAIGRLATRIRAAGPEEGFLAGRLVREATERLGPALDRALAEAGFDDGRVVALPRIGVKLAVSGTVSAAELGEAWAQAVARAILAAPPAAGRDPDEGAVAFRDAWAAEADILRAVLTGAAAPWWAASLGFDPATPLLPAILARWVVRDAVGAARRMAALLEAGLRADQLPDAGESARLAAALIAALRQAFSSLAPGGQPDGGLAPDEAAALAALTAGWSAAQRSAIGAMPADRRAPWIVALGLARAPASAAALPAMLPRLMALPAAMLRAVPAPQAAPTQVEAAMQETWCGGLLLLIRPLARLEPGWLALGPALPPRLLTLGLLALRRLAAPLPPAARRATLERDRTLLGLFAGVEAPDGPLEEAPLPHGEEAEAVLARLLAAMPAGVAHAPGALRRAYGRDPFAADRSTDLLCRLLLRPGRLSIEGEEALLAWPLDHADPALRKAGWDLDPGWVPWLGRRIRFRYGAP